MISAKHITAYLSALMLINTDIPSPSGLDGVSLIPILDNPNASIKKVARSQYPRHSEYGLVMGYSYRDTRYRYIEWVQKNFKKGETDGPVVERELYDYKKNTLETRNVVNDPAYSKIVTRMQSAVAKLRK